MDIIFIRLFISSHHSAVYEKPSLIVRQSSINFLSFYLKNHFSNIHDYISKMTYQVEWKGLHLVKIIDSALPYGQRKEKREYFIWTLKEGGK